MHDVLRISSGPSVLKCNFYYYLVMGRSTDCREMIGEKRWFVTGPKRTGGMPGPQSHLGKHQGQLGGDMSRKWAGAFIVCLVWQETGQGHQV